MMEIRQLCKSFEGRAVLENVDLTVPDGAVLWLIAPSGRGKTTLLRCIGGLGTPDGGTVTAARPPGRRIRTISEIAASSDGMCSRISDISTTSKDSSS